jgi:hypothetical protein
MISSILYKMHERIDTFILGNLGILDILGISWKTQKATVKPIIIVGSRNRSKL